MMVQTAAVPSYTLPGALEPFADESLIGLVTRTAYEHRFHDPMRLFRRIKRTLPSALWTFCQQDPASDEGQTVQHLLGLDDTTFRRLSMWTGDATTLAVQGWPVWGELVRHSTHAVCPLCLQQAAYHRSAWLVDVLPVCPTHGVWLRDTCPDPACRRPLSWSGTGIHRCGNRRCHYDLRHAPYDHCDQAVMGGMSATSRLLQCTDASKSPLGMPPGETLRMAFELGKISAGLERTARAPGFIRRELHRIPAIMDAGWTALDDWPNGFHALLERQRTRAADRAGKDGLRKAFGVMSKRVYDWAREPWGAPVGAAFADYAARCADLATTSHTLRRYAPGAEVRHLHLSLGEAQRLLGVAPMVMQAIAERRDMYVMLPRGAGTPALLRADLVRDLQEEMGDFILPEPARALVGTGRKVFDQLEAAGLFRRVPIKERLMPSRPYRGQEIRAFVTACLGKSPIMTRDAANHAGLTPLTRATNAHRSAADICRALMSGSLRPAACVRESRGLARLRFHLPNVEKLLPSGRLTLSIVEAAGELGIAYHSLHVWSRLGLLKTHKSDRGGERGLRLSQEDLAQFRMEFVTGGDLAGLFAQEGNHWLSRHLVIQGVSPVSGPGVDEATMTLFRRADITPAVIQAIKVVQAGVQGTPQDKHRTAFARVRVVANIVAARWGVTFNRVHNTFTDPLSGRVLQIISGHRPDLTGVFRFMVQRKSLSTLLSLPDSWVAFVPAGNEKFVLIPAREVGWRGLTLPTPYIALNFDRGGMPLEMREWAVEFSPTPV